jgi:hypothetical protein
VKGQIGTFQGIPVISTHTYPEVSDRAMQTAIALFVRADADGNADALKLARELVAAVAYARGEPMPELGAVGDRVDDRPRYQAAAADLVDSILHRWDDATGPTNASDADDESLLAFAERRSPRARPNG